MILAPFLSGEKCYKGLQGQGKTPARTEFKATGAAQRLQKGKRNDPVGDEQRVVDLGAKELAGRPEPDLTSAPGSGAAAPASIDASSPAPPETEHDPKKPTPGVVTENETAQAAPEPNDASSTPPAVYPTAAGAAEDSPTKVVVVERDEDEFDDNEAEVAEPESEQADQSEPSSPVPYATEEEKRVAAALGGEGFLFLGQEMDPWLKKNQASSKDQQAFQA